MRIRPETRHLPILMKQKNNLSGLNLSGLVKKAVIIM